MTFSVNFKMDENNDTSTGSVSNEDIFRYLTGFQEEIKKGIKEANDNVKEEISASVNRMKLNIDKRMEVTDEKIEELTKEAEKNKIKQIEQDKWMRRMETRMSLQEEEIKRSRFQKMKQNPLQQMDMSAGSELANKLAARLVSHFPKPPIEDLHQDFIGQAHVEEVELRLQRLVLEIGVDSWRIN